MDTIQDNTPTATATPEGYEAREVVWPGSEERFMALFPKQAEHCVEG